MRLGDFSIRMFRVFVKINSEWEGECCAVWQWSKIYCFFFSSLLSFEKAIRIMFIWHVPLEEEEEEERRRKWTQTYSKFHYFSKKKKKKWNLKWVWIIFSEIFRSIKWTNDNEWRALQFHLCKLITDACNALQIDWYYIIIGYTHKRTSIYRQTDKQITNSNKNTNTNPPSTFYIDYFI